MLGPGLAEIGNAAGRPEAADEIGAGRAVGHGIGGEQLQHREVGRLGRGAQFAAGGAALERGDQRLDAGEIQLALAPVEEVQRREAMFLDRLDLLGAEFRHRLAGEGKRAEAAVALVAAGAAGDLRHFGGGQPPPARAVELGQAGEGDMVDVHVEPHADRVGGDEIIDLARLIHGDLGVAGARGKRAHHHRRAAAHPAQHLGDRIDLLGREGDDGGARRQARELGRAGIAQGREARPADDLGLGEQGADHRLAGSPSRGSSSRRGRAREACDR